MIPSSPAFLWVVLIRGDPSNTFTFYAAFLLGVLALFFALNPICVFLYQISSHYTITPIWCFLVKHHPSCAHTVVSYPHYSCPKYCHTIQEFPTVLKFLVCLPHLNKITPSLCSTSHRASRHLRITDKQNEAFWVRTITMRSGPTPVRRIPVELIFVITSKFQEPADQKGARPSAHLQEPCHKWTGLAGNAILSSLSDPVSME